MVGSNPTGCKDDIEKRSDTIISFQLKKGNKESLFFSIVYRILFLFEYNKGFSKVILYPFLVSLPCPFSGKRGEKEGFPTFSKGFPGVFGTWQKKKNLFEGRATTQSLYLFKKWLTKKKVFWREGHDTNKKWFFFFWKDTFCFKMVFFFCQPFFEKIQPFKYYFWRDTSEKEGFFLSTIFWKDTNFWFSKGFPPENLPFLWEGMPG